jgi:hypothetical protein
MLILMVPAIELAALGNFVCILESLCPCLTIEPIEMLAATDSSLHVFILALPASG